ncbi:NADH/NAD(+) kinase SCDLUD_003389 [Saccharomycodes ludwigii]|uniref:NADH/NAD(+) kinase n=1 Tax=Saccharomycodes ludwigii TaxID=36035 RepID=UPI001E851177|nr:hypothetical protein SCDLUD_003389 [Saccharomycodes ludwigii]KAH3900410.1 hypothetical protein SCDLUD_003389 [Saccharomycodes ludwigii]
MKGTAKMDGGVYLENSNRREEEDCDENNDDIILNTSNSIICAQEMIKRLSSSSISNIAECKEKSNTVSHRNLLYNRNSINGGGAAASFFADSMMVGNKNNKNNNNNNNNNNIISSNDGNSSAKNNNIITNNNETDCNDNLLKCCHKRAKSHAQLAETAHGVRLLSKGISNTKFIINVEHLLIVTKHYDDSLIYLTRDLVEYILKHYPHIIIYVEDVLFANNPKFDLKEIEKECISNVDNINNNSSSGSSGNTNNSCRSAKNNLKYWNRYELSRSNSNETEDQGEDLYDLVITLGGDGTVLYVSSLFQKNVPPVMSFALGSLGFLTNFKFENYRKTVHRVLDRGRKIKTKLRMRLSCTVYRKNGDGHHYKDFERQVLNELTIDRGPSPFISNLELYGDKSLLTVAQADGLIIATPTGSTAYSLSAGGSLVYPSVNAIAVTPICPHTLSFRPIILPDSMVLKVKVPYDSRSTAWAAFDGKNRVELQNGDYVIISASPHSFPTIESKNTDFIDSISRTLNWNVREQQKSFSNMLSDKNKYRYEKQKKLEMAKKLCTDSENRASSCDLLHVENKKITSKDGNKNEHLLSRSDSTSSDSTSSSLSSSPDFIIGKGTDADDGCAIVETNDESVTLNKNDTDSDIDNEYRHSYDDIDVVEKITHEKRSKIKTIKTRKDNSVGGDGSKINFEL